MSASGNAGPLIVLAPLTPLPVPVHELVGPVARAFRSDVRVARLRVDLAGAHDASRAQYGSSRILLDLLDQRPPEADRLVGLVDVDLFVPVLTHVFGEAQLGGRVAVVSSFRFVEPPGGRSRRAPADLAYERLLKTVLHEIGHTRGLRHCRDSACVMTSANSVEMVDAKGRAFCLDCGAALAR